MSALLVISSAPALHMGKGLFLDSKFVEGMRIYSDLWNGPVSGILRRRSEQFAFGQTYDPQQLPFGLNTLPVGHCIGAKDIAEYDVILCCGDNHEYLHLPGVCAQLGKKIIYSIEYITETRGQIISLDRDRSLPRKLYSMLWMLNQERRRRRAFRRANGIQANGYPAFEAYRKINNNTMMYLDNRISEDLLATEGEVEQRKKRLLSGAPLRLIHSGRLEPMKGSQDLIKIARNLASKGVDFELDIFGTGSLEEELRCSIVEHRLQDHVRLNGVVDFERELVPFTRAHADIYLSCHRQSDPSCTYIESMGCGLAVAGYSNRMWSALCASSNAGWVAPLGNVDALADTIAEAAGDRSRLAACCEAAHVFAQAYSFEKEFHKRVGHLALTMKN